MALSPIQDMLSEGTETIVVTGSTPSSLGFHVVPAVVLLTDDDLPTITLTANDTTIAEGEGATSVTVTATFDDGMTRADDVEVALSLAGTASSSDYTATGLSNITIPMGQTSATGTVSLTPTDDQVDDDDETIEIRGAHDDFNVNAETITITDNDTASTKVTLTVSPATLAEANGGTAVPVTVTATLDGAVLASDVAVTLRLSGLARRNSDYTAPDALFDNTADITITAGQTSASQSFSFTPADDSVDDDDEKITVGGTANRGLALESASIAITDNDATPTVVNLSVNDDSVSEGEGATAIRVTATLGGTVTRTVPTVVTLSGTLGGTATKGQATGNDYTHTYGSLNKTITIPAGSLSADATATFSVAPVDDDAVEGDQTIVVSGSATNFTVNDATITLSDNDTASTSWTLSLSPTSVDEPRQCRLESATSVTVTATLDGGTLTSAVTVTLSVGGTSTATRGSTDDYTAASALGDGTVDITIAAGSKSASTSISVTALHDTLDEGTGETIVFSGVAAGGLTTTETATLTIDDNDTASTDISLSTNPASVNEGGSETTVTVTATLAGAATHTVDRTVAVEVVSVSGGATPSLDATSGDYRLKKFDDMAPSSVTLPISLGDITIPAGSSSGSADVQGDPQRRLGLRGGRDHPHRRHPGQLQRDPHRSALHRQRPAGGGAQPESRQRGREGGFDVGAGDRHP